MQITSEKAGLRPLNGCRTCGEDFTSTRLFDQHRIANEDDVALRRCLDSDEMTEGVHAELLDQGLVTASEAKKIRARIEKS